jgi:hypothetical protein
MAPRARHVRAEWPAWRFGPDGDKALFEKPEDVPDGWTKKPGQIFEAPEAKPDLCKETMIARLIDLKIKVDPRWGRAKLKEVLDDHCTSR